MKFSSIKGGAPVLTVVALFLVLFGFPLVGSQDSNSASVGDDPVLGEDGAPVTIIWFADFGSDFDKEWHQNVLPKIRENYMDKGKVKLAYKDNPISQMHPDSPIAHAAVNCVYENEGPNYSYGYMAKIFGNQDEELNESNLKEWASELGYSIGSCLSNNDYQSEISKDKQEAQDAGVQGTPTFIVKKSDSESGTLVQGAQPYSSFKQVIETKLPKKSEEDSGKDDFEYKIERNLENSSKNSGGIEVGIKNDPVLGSDDAPLTLIKYSDFGCPFCKGWHQNTLPKIERNFVWNGDLRIVYKDAPIPQLHPGAPKAHAAANCVYDNEGAEAFFDFTDVLYSNQDQFAGSTSNQDALVSLASDAGYDIESCLNNNDYQDEIDEDKQEAQAAGLQGTPHFVVKASDSDTGTPVQGAQPYSAFEQVIESNLPERSVDKDNERPKEYCEKDSQCSQGESCNPEINRCVRKSNCITCCITSKLQNNSYNPNNEKNSH